MATEAFCLFMIAIALLSGNESAKLAFSAFTDGIWAVVFWVGAVGIGFGIPLIASIIAGKRTESKVSFLLCWYLCDCRHDVSASVHPLCRTDEHHRLDAIKP